MNAPHFTCSAVLALGVSACAHGSALDARIEDLTALANQAREHGAYRCAPEELALAEAELEFARTELHLGDPERAQEHFVRAGANARAALRLSEVPSCAQVLPGEAGPAARNLGPSRADRLSMTHMTVRRGSTEDHASN